MVTAMSTKTDEMALVMIGEEVLRLLRLPKISFMSKPQKVPALLQI
jgi:hypothetical protein